MDLYDVVQPFFEVPAYHLILETVLLLWVLSLLVKKSYNPKLAVPLTDKEKDDLVEEWTPEPLVPDDAENDPVQYDVLEGKAGKYVTIKGREYMNLATHNFLGMVGDSRVEDAAVECLRKYGVGSCGPRAFFGTIDVHLDTEKRIREFMGTEDCCVYSMGFVTIASAIPAYAKRADIIYADESVCFSVQKGLQASRSHIRYFRHNDTSHLEQLLDQQAVLDRKNPKKAAVVRKFLVVEGIYAKTGELCALPELLRLKHTHKLRLFIDESFSFGVLGRTGHGVLEHFGASVTDVDLICVSMEATLGTTGGFTTGSLYVVDQQRLSGAGYVFSAALAPLCAAAAMKAIDLLHSEPEMLEQLRNSCRYMHDTLSTISGLYLGGDDISPLKYIYLAHPTTDRSCDEQILQNIVDACREEGVALTASRYLDSEEHQMPAPSIRLSCSRLLTHKDIDGVRDALSAAAAAHCVPPNGDC